MTFRQHSYSHVHPYVCHFIKMEYQKDWKRGISLISLYKKTWKSTSTCVLIWWTKLKHLLISVWISLRIPSWFCDVLNMRETFRSEKMVFFIISLEILNIMFQCMCSYLSILAPYDGGLWFSWFVLDYVNCINVRDLKVMVHMPCYQLTCFVIFFYSVVFFFCMNMDKISLESVIGWISLQHIF